MSERKFTGPSHSMFASMEQAPQDTQLSLFQAARAGDAIKFSQCVLDDADINQRTERGQTILMLAAGGSGPGALGIIQLLLDGNDAATHARDNLGWTALHYACSNNNQEAAIALIRSGSGLNAATIVGETSLMLAAVDGHQKIVDLLIDLHADVSRRDLEGKTALYHVAACGHIAVAKQLLRSGANVDARTLHNSTPLMTASDMGNIQMAKFLIRKRANVHAIDARGETVVFHCIRAHSSTFLADLIKMKAPLGQVNKDGQNVLDVAAELNLSIIQDQLAKALGLI